MRRVVRAGVGLVLAGSLSSVGFAPSASAAAAPNLDNTRHVRVDGYSIAIDCVGAGTPTVVLFSGFGDSHTIWSDFQRRLSRGTRVCSYDRLGEGGSSKPRGIQTLDSNARLLHAVLAKLNVRGPLVLVGHSIGGDVAVDYGRLYPRQTAGVVTFDATPPGYLQFVRRLIPAGSSGILQALRQEAVTVLSGRNQEHLKLAHATWVTPHSLGHVPLAVVEHGKNIFSIAGKYGPALQTHWSSGQMQIARASSRSQVVIAPRSGHYIYLDQPQLALDVTRAVIRESHR